jgi:hypothetical protein
MVRKAPLQKRHGKAGVALDPHLNHCDGLSLCFRLGRLDGGDEVCVFA